MSFYNQFVHDYLDRTVVLATLQAIAEADGLVSVREGTSWEDLERAAVGAEPTVIRALAAKGFPLPEGQHIIIRDPEGTPVAEADLLFPGRVIAQVQGDPHEQKHVQMSDAEKIRRLKSLGYHVVEIRPATLDDDLKVLAQRLGILV